MRNRYVARQCKLRVLAEQFIAATNAPDVGAALELFTENAVTDDPSTGLRFYGHAGIRTYVELLSLHRRADRHARVRVDFRGDFGHEIGLLDFTLSAGGQIERIDAELV